VVVVTVVVVTWTEFAALVVESGENLTGMAPMALFEQSVSVA